MPVVDKLIFFIVLQNLFSLIVITGAFVLSSQIPVQKSLNFSILPLLAPSVGPGQSPGGDSEGKAPEKSLKISSHKSKFFRAK